MEKDHIALDLTMGKGKDTLTLASRARFVYAFDIQSLAIEETKLLLEKKGLLDKVRLIEDSHEHVLSYVQERVDVIIMNLGYLPGGDKTIITRWASTQKAIEDGLSLLKKHGLFFISLYKSHKGAEEEVEGLNYLIKSLDQKSFEVHKISFPNQRNLPPDLFIIERIGE